MADRRPAYGLRKHDASQVVSVRDRTSVHRGDRARSCELSQRLTLRVIRTFSDGNQPSVISRAVTGCNLCSRSDLSPMFPAARQSWAAPLRHAIR
jgi:hypothetical protein